MGQRDFYYDNLKGLLIILVVLMHFLGGVVAKSDLISKSIILFVYYFHMPLFIFISGYFSKKPEKARASAFRSLFMVFLVAQLFWVIFKYIANDSTYYMVHFFSPGYAIWYIVALFFWRILLADLVKIKHIVIISFLISPFIMLLHSGEMLLAINKTIGFMIYFLLGYYCQKETIEKIRNFPTVIAALGLVVIFAVTYILLSKGIITYGGTKNVMLHTMCLYDFDSIGMGILIYYLAIPVSIITSVLVMAVMPQKRNILATVGGDTLPLYLSHTYFLILADLFFAAVAISYGVQLIVIAVVSILLIVLFSTSVYRKLFHKVYDTLINLFYPCPQKK